MRFTVASTAALVASATATLGHYKEENNVPSYGSHNEYETASAEIPFPTDLPAYTSAEPVYESSSTVDSVPTGYEAISTSAVEPTGYTSAQPTTAYVTETVSDYVTYCPSATELTHGDVTYTVTEPTTLTITDGCPCTVTKPVEASSTADSAPSTLQTYPSAPAASETAQEPYPTASHTTDAAAAPYTPVPNYPASNATAPLVPSPTTSLPAQFTGAAGKTSFSIAAVFALAVFAL